MLKRREEKKEERKEQPGAVLRADNPFFGKQLADILDELEGPSPNMRNLESLRDSYLKDPEWAVYNPQSSASLKRKTKDVMTDLIEVQHKLGAAMAAIHELNERLGRFSS
ncbi:unnamed protein product [Blepharisma stoltei]|uniref:Uncharacterized protein n=1 Tax=Blepharisma stoltei TaxID=1481888 RepID=A0AAU9J0H1_9CILI|nr:unnamed protein product [Blepharisma stoltei]